MSPRACVLTTHRDHEPSRNDRALGESRGLVGLENKMAVPCTQRTVSSQLHPGKEGYCHSIHFAAEDMAAAGEDITPHAHGISKWQNHYCHDCHFFSEQNYKRG